MKRNYKIITTAALTLLILVIAIGVLAPLGSRTRCPPVDPTRLLLNNVGEACRSYLAEYRELPASLADLDHNRKNLVFMYWGKSGTNDSWGNPLRFKPYDASLGYGSVISCGRDGRQGGKGPDADIEVRFGEKKR